MRSTIIRTTTDTTTATTTGQEFENGPRAVVGKKCREIENAGAIGNGRKIYRLIRNTSPRKPSLSEVIT